MFVCVLYPFMSQQAWSFKGKSIIITCTVPLKNNYMGKDMQIKSLQMVENQHECADLICSGVHMRRFLFLK